MMFLSTMSTNTWPQTISMFKSWTSDKFALSTLAKGVEMWEKRLIFSSKLSVFYFVYHFLRSLCTETKPNTMNACEFKTEHYSLTASLSCLFARCFKFSHSEQQESLFLQMWLDMQTYTQDISILALVTTIKIVIKNTPHDYLCVEGVPCSDNPPENCHS